MGEEEKVTREAKRKREEKKAHHIYHKCIIPVKADFRSPSGDVRYDGSTPRFPYPFCSLQFLKLLLYVAGWFDFSLHIF